MQFTLAEGALAPSTVYQLLIPKEGETAEIYFLTVLEAASPSLTYH